MVDPTGAQAFLQRFPTEVRRKGEAWFHGGQVADLVVRIPGRNYAAFVGPANRADLVSLNHNPRAGWGGTCTCELRSNCDHVYAAMCGLLSEHRTAVVRSLSSSSAGVGAAALQDVLPTPPDLHRRLVSELGRALKPDEKKFVVRIQNIFKRCQQLGHVTRWDFNEMGLGLPGGSFTWGTVEIWPTPPKNEVEFWHYVANAAQQAGVAIPKFMAPITDLGPVREKIAHWQREREVHKWRQALGNFTPPANDLAAAVPAPADLRVVFDEATAELQWLRPGAETFEPLKPTQAQRLWQGHSRGEVQFTDEGEMIWHFLGGQLYSPPPARLDYTYPQLRAPLGRLFRTRQLDSRLVNRQGKPLVRPEDPLRWAVAPANGEEDDYRLCLVRADGTPCPKFCCILPGRPALYVTTEAVFRGPPPVDGVLNATGETRIPAPALESAPGVTLLRSLGVELPARVRERVRLLPLQVTISGELRPPLSGRHEECVLRIVAQAPDGFQETYNGFTWNNSTPRGTLKKAAKPLEITVYERAVLETIPALLEPLNPKTDLHPGQLTLRVTRRFPEDFAAWLKSVPGHITVELLGELASFSDAAVAGRVKLEVTEAEIDWFDLRVVLDVSDLTLSKDEIRLLLNAKGRFVRIEGKGWRRLQFDLSPEEDERLARLGLSPRELSAEPQRLHALQLADEAARKLLPEQQVDQIQRRASELKARVAPALPEGVTAQLRPYQLEGFHFLAYLAANRFGGILADDMGLGKTLQTLAWLLWLRQERAKPLAELPSLVVCPKSVMDNWHAEAVRFTPSLRVRVWSPGEMGEFTDHLGDADLHVINYAQLRSLGESLAAIRWLAVILDEGQYIKNPTSITAQVARVLRAEQRLVLSGTPIENRLLDLWSLMSFVMPGVLGSRTKFAQVYDAKDDPLARRRLAARVRPFLIRRTKAQVASDLPDRIEEDLACEMEGEQKALYRAEFKRAQQVLLAIQTQKELADQQFYFLVSLLRLRQVCCHPKLVVADSKAPSAKVEALLEQLEPIMEEGQKVLVFSQFVTMLDLLRPIIEERGWPAFYLAGDTEDRGDLVRQFQATEGPAVFLISLKAGGFGLNLTAASYVILFDPWWNPAVENQAIDRTHRIGQTNKVVAYRLLIKDSIEEKIRVLQKQKQALAEDVLGEERFSQSLTLDDLRFLFAD